ncbi:hypothetical protein BASA81_007975 [Batrachochytrium salamandrivorans]|nr:hypothetical protein BASA81_007975 [Batrachochytrium salamandrivorans]
MIGGKEEEVLIATTRHPRRNKLRIGMNPSSNEKPRRWCCSMRVCVDFKCCQKCQPDMEELSVVIPIKSLDGILSGAYAFDLIKPDIIEFIIQRSWDALLFQQPIILVVQTLEEGDLERKRELEIALQNSFRYQGKMTYYEAVRAGSEGWWSALLALIVYGICIGCIFPLVQYYTSTQEIWASYLADLFIIVMWVAIWHPTETLIFSRLMIRRKRLICKKLEDADVVLQVLGVDNLLSINPGVTWGLDVFEDEEGIALLKV